MSTYSQIITKRKNTVYGILAVAISCSLGVSLFLIAPYTQSVYAATSNGNCTLIVPNNPLSAQGLATPYQLVATNPQNSHCNEANPLQSAFVQGAIINPVTGQIWIYNPLVVDLGSQPAIQPRLPFNGTIPAEDIVALWFGTNSTQLTLQGTTGSLQAARCVMGSLEGSPFRQFAYCNAPTFFKAAHWAIQTGTLVPPPLGMAKDGMVCPTVRDFSLVDVEQSDVVTTTYRVTATGLTEQETQANTKLSPGQVIANSSDNRLLIEVKKALGCNSWMEPDLADPGNTVSALPLNELQADMLQGDPMALIPNRDPMTLVNGRPSLSKLNAYRDGVDQPQESDSTQSNTTVYCQHLVSIAPKRMKADAQLLGKRPSPDTTAANSLLTYMAQQFIRTYGTTGLDCIDKIKPNQVSPIAVQTNTNGMAIQATYNGQPMVTPNVPSQGSVVNAKPHKGGSGGDMTFDCVFNGTMVNGCNGTTKMDERTCNVVLNTNMRQITIDCR